MTNQITAQAALPAPQIKMSEPSDVIALVPYLLGFHPTDSLVVLVLAEGQVRLTSRVDLAACFQPDYLAAMAEMLKQRCPDSEFLLVAYSEDRQLADDALGLAEIAFDADLIIESIAADGERFWSRGCVDSACCPSAGSPYPSSNAPILAEAIGAGLAALASRDQLEAQVRALSSDELQAAELEVQRARSKLLDMSLTQRCQLLDDLICDATSSELERHRLVLLGLLVQEVRLRDRAWLRMERDSAQQLVRLWTAVVRELPDQEVLPALCLAGMAAWLSGNGALQVACIVRGKQLDANYSMLHLVEALNLTAADPQVWDQMAELKVA